jgi:hypothetical protein
VASEGVELNEQLWLLLLLLEPLQLLLLLCDVAVEVGDCCHESWGQICSIKQRVGQS